MIYLYRQPEPGEFCVIGADPAEGGDNSAFAVLSKKNSDLIMLGKSQEESSQLGYTLNSVGKWLKSKTKKTPCIGVERNTGVATIFVLKQLNYPFIYRRMKSFTEKVDEVTDDYGWWTNQQTRPKMLDDLKLAVRQKLLTIPSKLVIEEMFTFIRNKRTGRPEADSNSHDDLIFALAIAWQLYQVIEPLVTDQEEVPKNDFTNWSI